ncbi:MAG: DUF368 domain-containing protein [Syntrophomonadaceae bacterium]|nr:DUF368 domain-containing protein [Syntrophomonadaceae bacterium]
MNKDIWLLFLKGIPIGISNVLPGISGGTIAVVLRIYDTLINGIKTINLKVIIPIGLGAFLGLLATASLVDYLLDNYTSFMMAFIFGLIISSAKVTVLDIKKINLVIIGCLIAGLALALLIAYQPTGLADAQTIVSTKRIIFGGVFASISMLLPGISGATVLILLGIYEFIIEALLSLNILIISIFAVSAICGMLAFSWLLAYLLQNYRSELMSLLTGLIIGSALVAMPTSFIWTDCGGIILGVLIVLLLSRNSAT